MWTDRRWPPPSCDFLLIALLSADDLLLSDGPYKASQIDLESGKIWGIKKWIVCFSLSYIQYFRFSYLRLNRLHWEEADSTPLTRNLFTENSLIYEFISVVSVSPVASWWYHFPSSPVWSQLNSKRQNLMRRVGNLMSF